MFFMWLSRQTSFENLVKPLHKNKNLKNKKSHFNQKNLILLIFLNHDFFQPCAHTLPTAADWTNITNDITIKNVHLNFHATEHLS